MEQTTAVSNIYGVGVCNINYNGNNLGATKGGVTVTLTPNRYNRTIDKYGPVPVNMFDLGMNISVTTPLVEETSAQIRRFLVEGTTSGTTTTFGRQAATELTGYLLILEPYDDSAHDIVIYSAVPRFDGALVHTNDGDRIYNVIWEGKIDESRTENDKLFRIDESYSWSSSSTSVSK